MKQELHIPTAITGWKKEETSESLELNIIPQVRIFIPFAPLRSAAMVGQKDVIKASRVASSCLKGRIRSSGIGILQDL
jgi:hypothetical protein